MDCKAVIRQLSEFLDGELDPAVTKELQEHLAQCDDCHVVVDTTRKTIEIYCDTEPMPMPPGVRERLQAALAEKLRGRSS